MIHRKIATDRRHGPIAARYGPRFVIGRSNSILSKRHTGGNGVAPSSTTAAQELTIAHSLSTTGADLRQGFIVDIGDADAIGAIVPIGAAVASGAIDDIGDADGAGETGCAFAASVVTPATSVPAHISPANQRFIRFLLL
jgi:hypothetical protein